MAPWLKNYSSRAARVLLVWAVLFTVSTATDKTEIVPLSYLSGKITFNAWIDLITLSLAPLLAHLACGAPRTTLIDDSVPKPRWHDRMCHYNPTSVLWRYYAIADRRLRSTKWTEKDMAAANAVFWTKAGWDGSEVAALESERYLQRIPRCNKINLMSWQTVQTVIVTLQGSQAVYILFGIRTHKINYHSFALDFIFAPLAGLSLLRVFSAAWLTDNFSYSQGHHLGEISKEKEPASPGKDAEKLAELPRALPTTQIEPGASAAAATRSGQGDGSAPFLPVTCWRSRLLRFMYIVPVFCIWAMTLADSVPWEENTLYSASNLMLCIFYTLCLTTSIFILGYYFVRERECTTVVLPCISTIWYKMFSGLIIASMVVVFTIAAIETRQSPCGKYTTFPPEWDAELCPGTVYLNAANRSGYFGIAEGVPSLTANGDDFVIVNFTGLCLASTT